MAMSMSLSQVFCFASAGLFISLLSLLFELPANYRNMLSLPENKLMTTITRHSADTHPWQIAEYEVMHIATWQSCNMATVNKATCTHAIASKWTWSACSPCSHVCLYFNCFCPIISLENRPKLFLSISGQHFHSKYWFHKFNTYLTKTTIWCRDLNAEVKVGQPLVTALPFVHMIHYYTK